MNSPSTRDIQRRVFLSETDFADSRLSPLQQDASFRRYFRIDDGEHGCLLMDAPPETENLTAWLEIGNHLNHLGLRAPAVLRSNTDAGFALIEDFGSSTFTQLLNAGEPHEALYTQAIDLLIHLHQQPNALLEGLKPYGFQALMTEALSLIHI